MKDKNLFTLSESGNSGEYTASIVRIKNLRPIEGSDFLVQVEAAGEDVVVRKDEVSEGDVMVYCRIETVLDPDFLGANNLFDPDNYYRNRNAAEYEKTLAESGKEEARKLCGYFNKWGRVRIARLRGCPSKGFLFKKEDLVKWDPSFSDVNLEDYLDIPFWDTIKGKQFLKVYIPFVPSSNKGKGSKNTHNIPQKPKFDRIIPEYFSFHYDTSQLTTMIKFLKPDDVVDISVKLHGTSSINGNILTRYPIQLSSTDKVFNRIWKTQLSKINSKKGDPKLKYSKQNLNISSRIEELKTRIKPTSDIKFGDVYSSRKIILNQYIDRNILGGSGFYNSDVWALYYELLKGKIEEGTTIYGEIIGYVEGSPKMIQKNYDYGCELGKSKLMIYRVVHQDPGKEKVELDILDILSYTEKLIKKYPELKDRIHPIDLLYHGTLRDLYPNLNTEDEDWCYNVLRLMKTDERFGLEKREPLCKNNVVREGIVLRVSGNPRFCAKLKSAEFLGKEAKAYDKGEVDIETAQLG